MTIVEDSVDEDEVVLVIVSPQDYAWLKRLERLTGDDVPVLISSMLHDIRIDDEAAHGENDAAERPRRAH